MQYINNIYKLFTNTDDSLLKIKYRQDIEYFITNKNNAIFVIDNWDAITKIVIDVGIIDSEEIHKLKEMIKK